MNKYWSEINIIEYKIFIKKSNRLISIVESKSNQILIW